MESEKLPDLLWQFFCSHHPDLTGKCPLWYNMRRQTKQEAESLEKERDMK